MAAGDHALFTSIPGIGRKTAERVVIDLKDKVGARVDRCDDAAPPSRCDDHTAARDALVGLGMSVAEAEAALRDVDAELPGRGAGACGAWRWPGRREHRRPAHRIPDALLAPGEEEFDRSLRPRSLAEFVGQEQLKEQLSIFLEAAKARGEPCEHVLLAGPPGLGKTSLAAIIAAEMGSHTAGRVRARRSTARPTWRRS